MPTIMGIALVLVSACKKAPVASFTISPVPAVIGDTINFQNTSEGANTFDWDFGDGNGSTEENPSHIYTKKDRYTIHLEASNAVGSDEANKDLWIHPPPVWTSRTDMPAQRWGHSASVVDGKIYIIGGSSVYGNGELSSVYEYDPATDTWTKKSNMPTARQMLSTNVVNGKIYAIGGGKSPLADGYDGTESYSTVEEYDPATDTWTKKSDMPTARWTHSASVVDNKIYIFGGSPSYPFTTINALEVYHPATDTWTQKGTIPRPISDCFTAVIAGKIYAIGGALPFSDNSHRVDEYNPATGRWTEKANMPTPRALLLGSVLDNKIYAIGGYTGSDYTVMATVEIYDPATDTWTAEGDMTTARARASISTVEGKIYAIGGMTDWDSKACGKVEVYDK